MIRVFTLSQIYANGLAYDFFRILLAPQQGPERTVQLSTDQVRIIAWAVGNCRAISRAMHLLPTRAAAAPGLLAGSHSILITRWDGPSRP